MWSPTKYVQVWDWHRICLSVGSYIYLHLFSLSTMNICTQKPVFIFYCQTYSVIQSSCQVDLFLILLFSWDVTVISKAWRMKICLPARRNIAAGSMKEKVPVAEAGREHEGNAGRHRRECGCQRLKAEQLGKERRMKREALVTGQRKVRLFLLLSDVHSQSLLLPDAPLPTS